MATKAEIVKAVKRLERAEKEVLRSYAERTYAPVLRAERALEAAKTKLFNLVKS